MFNLWAKNVPGPCNLLWIWKCSMAMEHLKKISPGTEHLKISSPGTERHLQRPTLVCPRGPQPTLPLLPTRFRWVFISSLKLFISSLKPTCFRWLFISSLQSCHLCSTGILWESLFLQQRVIKTVFLNVTQHHHHHQSVMFLLSAARHYDRGQKTRWRQSSSPPWWW